MCLVGGALVWGPGRQWSLLGLTGVAVLANQRLLMFYA
jgi:hypothetical protein